MLGSAGKVPATRKGVIGVTTTLVIIAALPGAVWAAIQIVDRFRNR